MRSQLVICLIVTVLAQNSQVGFQIDPSFYLGWTISEDQTSITFNFTVSPM